MLIRTATAADRVAILALMRPRDYNRINLDPRCFVVAEQDGAVVGIGQVKRHRDGAAELASLVVARDQRRQGIGSAIVHALSARHPGQLYLFCLAELESYYARLGFRRVERSVLPASLARMHWAADLLGRLPLLAGRPRLQVIAMKRLGIE